VLVVWKLARLGQSLRDLIALLDELKARDVAFRSLTEAIDTTTPTGRAMWHMVGIWAELERSLIQERTKAGRAAAQAREVKRGRKPLLSVQHIAHARKLLEQGECLVHVAPFSRCRGARWRGLCELNLSFHDSHPFAHISVQNKRQLCTRGTRSCDDHTMSAVSREAR
jgi:Resolvase, N terminal domain